MAHQTDPKDPNSWIYGHTIGEYPNVAKDLALGKSMPTNPSVVRSDEAKNFVDTNNARGVSGSQPQDFSAYGGLKTFMPDATKMYNAMYGVSEEEQAKEDRIRLGMNMLTFFTQMGAEASKPGATALGAANIAGANTAQQYINQVEAKKARDFKIKSDTISFASKLKASQDAKDIALAKANNVKPSKPDKYKILNVAEVAKSIKLPTNNPFTGEAYKEGDIIDLTPAEFNRVPRGNLTSFKEVTPQKPNPFEKLRLDVTNVVQKYIDNENVIEPLDATNFNSSIFKIQKDRFTEIDGEDGTKQTIVEEGLDLLSILKQSYGEDKINKLLTRMGITPTSDTPITDQINNENKNKIEPKEKEVAENGDVTEYKIVNVGNKKIRVLSSRKEKMSSALVVSLANSKQALKDLDRATRIFFPNGKYDPKISLQTSTLGSNSLGDARIAHQAMKRSIEVILRLRTGAAAPAEEVTSYMNQFMPNILDGRESAEIKLNALIDFFEAVTKGINEGRRPDDKTWVRRPNSNFIKDVIKDGGQIGDRKIKIIKNVPHIQKEKGSDIYLPIK